VWVHQAAVPLSTAPFEQPRGVEEIVAAAQLLGEWLPFGQKASDALDGRDRPAGVEVGQLPAGP
jgi:hypothetical protein